MTDLTRIRERHPLPWTMHLTQRDQHGQPVLYDADGRAVGFSTDEAMSMVVAWTTGVQMNWTLARAAGFIEPDHEDSFSMTELVAHIEQTRAIAQEASDDERMHDTERVAVLNTALLLGLVSEHAEPDRRAAAHAVYEWAQARRNERDHHATVAAMATEHGLPQMVEAVHRQAADRVVGAVVTELRALGWRGPGE